MLESLDRELDVPQAIEHAHNWLEAAQVLDYPVLAILAGERKSCCAPTPR